MVACCLMVFLQIHPVSNMCCDRCVFKWHHCLPCVSLKNVCMKSDDTSTRFGRLCVLLLWVINCPSVGSHKWSLFVSGSSGTNPSLLVVSVAMRTWAYFSNNSYIVFCLNWCLPNWMSWKQQEWLSIFLWTFNTKLCVSQILEDLFTMCVNVPGFNKMDVQYKERCQTNGESERRRPLVWTQRTSTKGRLKSVSWIEMKKNRMHWMIMSWFSQEQGTCCAAFESRIRYCMM